MLNLPGDPKNWYHSRGVKEEGAEDIGQKVIEHRNSFHRLLNSRYRELLPMLIVYQHPDNPDIHVDWLSVEMALRQNYRVAIGDTTQGTIGVLGVVKDTKHKQGTTPANLFQNKRYTEQNIEFTLPAQYRYDKYLELSHQDDFKTGNFVVLENKPFSLVSDFDIVYHYSIELAEITTSRFSLSMQSKIVTFFIDEIGNESVNKLVNQLYNGFPYVKTSKLFDPEEQIVQMNNDGLANNFVELKREYQNKLSELNNMLGVNSLAVEKASGVSDVEAKGNQSFTGANANIYLESRNHALKGLNKKYGLNIKAVYNDNVKSELSLTEGEDLLKADMGGGESEDNNNPRNNIET